VLGAVHPELELELLLLVALVVVAPLVALVVVAPLVALVVVAPLVALVVVAPLVVAPLVPLLAGPVVVVVGEPVVEVAPAPVDPPVPPEGASWKTAEPHPAPATIASHVAHRAPPVLHPARRIGASFRSTRIATTVP
jgi:hypothetical protein